MARTWKDLHRVKIKHFYKRWYQKRSDISVVEPFLKRDEEAFLSRPRSRYHGLRYQYQLTHQYNRHVPRGHFNLFMTRPQRRKDNKLLHICIQNPLESDTYMFTHQRKPFVYYD